MNHSTPHAVLFATMFALSASVTVVCLGLAILANPLFWLVVLAIVPPLITCAFLIEDTEASGQETEQDLLVRAWQIFAKDICDRLLGITIPGTKRDERAWRIRLIIELARGDYAFLSEMYAHPRTFTRDEIEPLGLNYSVEDAEWILAVWRHGPRNEYDVSVRAMLGDNAEGPLEVLIAGLRDYEKHHGPLMER